MQTDRKENLRRMSLKTWRSSATVTANLKIVSLYSTFYVHAMSDFVVKNKLVSTTVVEIVDIGTLLETSLQKYPVGPRKKQAINRFFQQR